MKKSIVLFATLLFSVSSANAQWGNNEKIKGNGNVTTESRTTGEYEKVLLIGSMDVDLVNGTEGQLKVEAESNLHEYIVTEVENGILKIRVKKGVSVSPSGSRDIKITVPFKELEGVSLTGSGDINGIDVIKAENFDTNLTGSGNMNLNLEVSNLEGRVTGSGDIDLKGLADKFNCTVTGSGDFNASDLKANVVEAVVSGSGDIQVTAISGLKARVSGSGDISYKGNPKNQDFKTSGSGSVSSM